METTDLGHGGIPANPYHPHAWLLADPVIGEGCWIGPFSVLDGSGGLRIGKGTSIGPGAQVYTHSSVARTISEGATPIERRATRIGDYVHVGPNAVVLMGCDIGDHTVIAPGAVVSEGTVVPSYSVVFGVPAKVIKNGTKKFAVDQATSEGP